MQPGNGQPVMDLLGSQQMFFLASLDLPWGILQPSPPRIIRALALPFCRTGFVTCLLQRKCSESICCSEFPQQLQVSPSINKRTDFHFLSLFPSLDDSKRTCKYLPFFFCLNWLKKILFTWRDIGSKWKYKAGLALNLHKFIGRSVK